MTGHSFSGGVHILLIGGIAVGVRLLRRDPSGATPKRADAAGENPIDEADPS